LSSPVDNAKVSAGPLPDFKFTLSETAPWDSNKSDFFNFMPTIREKTGETLFSGMYAYDVVNDKLWFLEQGYGWNKIIDTFGGVLSDYFIFNDQTNEITLKSSLFQTKANIYGSDPLKLRSGITTNGIFLVGGLTDQTQGMAVRILVLHIFQKLNKR